MSDAKLVTITVSGVSGCGKTTIAVEIVRCLRELGIHNVILSDAGVDVDHALEGLQDLRVRSVQDRQVIVRTQGSK
jgi:molybdopterin-guanine dinucleotide biosynthesis protein